MQTNLSIEVNTFLSYSEHIYKKSITMNSIYNTRAPKDCSDKPGIDKSQGSSCFLNGSKTSYYSKLYFLTIKLL